MSKRTGFLYDERYQLHLTGNYHPEVPDRLPSVYKGIEDASLLEKLTLIEATPADLKWVETIHDHNYIKRFATACAAGNNILDSPDNQMCTVSYEIAYPAQLKLDIVTVEGRLVRTLWQGIAAPGRHRIDWDGTDARGRRVASGVYLYRVSSGVGTATRKMVLLQ